MNYHFRRLAVTIGLSALVGSALLIAGTGNRGTAQVPFDFRVQDRTMPAGAYTVEEMNVSGVIKIRNEDTGEAIMVLAPPRVSGAPGEPKLVFNRYGDRCFLSQVWFASEGLGHTLDKSRLEKEIAGVNKTPAMLSSIHLK